MFKYKDNESDQDSPNSSLMRKRQLKELNKNSSDDLFEDCDDDTFKNEDCGKRIIKPKKFFDEEFPPEDPKYVRQKSITKTIGKSNVALILPRIKKSDSKIMKNKEFMAELESDDEDYKKANLR